jgi:hypothetical protein
MAYPALVKNLKVGRTVLTIDFFFLRVVRTAPISFSMKLMGIGTGPDYI